MLENMKSGKCTREITECRHHGMCNENLLNNKIDIDNTDFLERQMTHDIKETPSVVLCVTNKQLPGETQSVLLNGDITSPGLKCTFLLLLLYL